MAKKNQNETYSYLDRLSTEQLEELLRADLASPDQNNEAVIFHILEIMEKREKENPTGRLPDIDQAWADFQQYYEIPEGEGQSLYPGSGEPSANPAAAFKAKRYPRPRKALVIAAILIVLFGGMLTAQASGINVFGALGQWTEETFHFNFFSVEETQTGNKDNSEDTSAFQKAAATCGIPQSMVPAWSPKGFEVSEPQIDSIENYMDSIISVYTNEKEGRSFSVSITRYYDEQYIEAISYEKDNQMVRSYESGEKIFYIMSNLGDLSAVWTDGVYVEMITGQLEMDELTKIIDSMGD